MQLRHLWIVLHELRDPACCRLRSRWCRVNRRLECALLLGSLVLHLLRGLVRHRLLHLLELLGELKEFAALVNVDHHALRWQVSSRQQFAHARDLSAIL